VFEAVSVLLLIAVIAAVVVARSRHPIAGSDGEALDAVDDDAHAEDH
jgi:hypothetical protein